MKLNLCEVIVSPHPFYLGVSFLEHIVELSKSKYARNIVKKFLMYG